MGGYVKIYRDLYEHPIVHKDNDYLSVWIYLLLNATHTEMKVEFNKQNITLEKGQLICGRLQISEKSKVEQSKVERILKRFISEQMIEQQTTTKNRLITILNWSKYQKVEQQIEQVFEQQMNNECTTNEQQMNTNNNDNNVIIKELKNKDKDLILKDTLSSKDERFAQVVEYLNIKSHKNYRLGENTKKLIKARFKEGFTLNDFYKVIDNQCSKWLDDSKMSDYLRPQTLFGTKFESYLNAKEKPITDNYFLQKVWEMERNGEE